MKIKKNIVQLIIMSFIFLFIPSASYADENNDISIDNIFNNEQGLWYPGRIESKDFYIKNNKENDIKIDRLYMQLKSSKNLKTNEILDINSKNFKELSKNSNVRVTHNDNLIFEDTLNNLISEKGIVLDKEIAIKAKGKELLNMTIYMDESMGNDAQAIESIFNIGVAYKIDESSDIGGTTDDGNNFGKLPQTGGIINSTSLLSIGAIVIGAGIVLNKKKEEGGKHHE